MQIVAYKCPDTHKIFEDKTQFDKHRRKLLADKQKVAQALARIKAIDLEWQKIRESAHSFDEIKNWILSNSDLLIESASRYGFKPLKSFKLLSVDIKASWQEQCSNSHHAPKDGVTNWFRLPSQPLYYPGYAGKITFRWEGRYEGFFSSLFAKAPICLGSGSGSDTSYSCQVTFFASDWPGLLSQQIVAGLLENL